MAANRSAEVSVEQIKLRMGQSHDHLTVRGERTSQRPDRTTELHQPRQLVGHVLGNVRHDLRVELLKFALDLLEGTEVASDHPIDNRRDKGR